MDAKKLIDKLHDARKAYVLTKTKWFVTKEKKHQAFNDLWNLCERANIELEKSKDPKVIRELTYAVGYSKGVMRCYKEEE